MLQQEKVQSLPVNKQKKLHYDIITSNKSLTLSNKLLLAITCH